MYFLPKLDSTISWIEALANPRYKVKQKLEITDEVENKLTDVFNHFELSIKKQYPLKMYKYIDKHRLQLGLLILYVD